MLEVVQFADGTYGIRNTWTGILLSRRSGKTLSYKTPEKAHRKMRKCIEDLNRFAASL